MLELTVAGDIEPEIQELDSEVFGVAAVIAEFVAGVERDVEQAVVADFGATIWDQLSINIEDTDNIVVSQVDGATIAPEQLAYIHGIVQNIVANHFDIFTQQQGSV